MSVAHLREKASEGGVLLAQIESPTVLAKPTRVRNGAGKCRVSIPTDDPAIDVLVDATPTDGRLIKTWFDTDVELAWWDDEQDPETDVPRWAGPVVSGVWKLGRVEIEAWTEEAYVLRGSPFGDLTNFLGFSDFDADDDLSTWTITGTASTTTSGPQFTGTRSALVDGSMHATAVQFPVSEAGNYAHVSVAVYVPSGVTPFGDLVGIALETTSEVGMGVWIPGEEYYLRLPSGWEHDRWYWISVQVRQEPAVDVRYRVTLLGGDDAIRFSRPKVTRPANIGATAGSDYGTILSAISQGFVDNQPGIDARDNDPVGVDLAGNVRYFLDDRAQGGQLVNDHVGLLDWWVKEGTIYSTPTRGELKGSYSLSAGDLSDWSLAVDASSAVTEMIGQIGNEGPGPAEEVVATVSSPNRLVGVEQVPAEIGPADADLWTGAALDASAPVVSVSGVPARATGPDDPDEYDLGDWFEVTLTDGRIGPVTLEPVVNEIAWDPRSGRTTPTWTLGGKGRPDAWALLAAQLAAAERERRRRIRAATPPTLGQVVAGEETHTPTGGTATADVSTPEGRWLVSWEHHIDSADAVGSVTGYVEDGGGFKTYGNPGDLSGGGGSCRGIAIVSNPWGGFLAAPTVSIVTDVALVSGSVDERTTSWQITRIS